MTKTFVQFAHGVLTDIEDFGRRHSHPLPSFNPAPEDLPGGADATLQPVVEHPVVYANVPLDAATMKPFDPAVHTPAAPGQEGYTAPVDHNVKPEKTAEEDEADAQSQVDARDVPPATASDAAAEDSDATKTE